MLTELLGPEAYDMGRAILAGLGMMGAGLAGVLRVIAPRTPWKGDDRLLDFLGAFAFGGRPRDEDRS